MEVICRHSIFTCVQRLYMRREKHLVKNTIILSMGTFFPKVVALITLPILTGSLTKAEYGIYDLVTTLVSLLLPVATLQIQSAAFRFLIECRGDKEQSSKIVTNIFIVTIPTTLIILLFVFFGFSSTTIINRLLICSYYFIDIIYLELQQIVRGLDCNMHYSVGTIILSLTNMVSVVMLISGMKTGLSGVLIALMISCLIASVYLTRVMFAHVNINIRKYASLQCIKEMLNYSWPMVPNNLSNWVLSVSDRLVITAVLGVEANAIYAVATKIPNLFSSLQGTFVLAWQENASIASKDNDATNYYTEMYYRVYCLLIGGMACMIAITPLIFKIAIRGDYNDAYEQMPILFIAIIFSCMSAFLGGIYVAKKNIKSVGITTVCAAICNLLIDIGFVKKIGIYAGSISTLISYFFLLIFRMVELRKKYGIQYKLKEMISLFFILLLITTLCYMQNVYCNLLNFFIAIILFYVSNKKLIGVVLKKITTKKLIHF